jgi:hypothetical protein
LIADLPLDRLGLLFDSVVAVLLVATIVYAAILDRRLSVLRESRKAMEQLIDRFAEATGKAETVLAEIRAAAGETGQALQSAIEKGNMVADDLMFLVERAGSLADRLAGTGRAAREASKVNQRLDKSRGEEVAAAPPLAPNKTASAEDAEQEPALMRTLRGMR